MRVAVRFCLRQNVLEFAASKTDRIQQEVDKLKASNSVRLSSESWHGMGIRRAEYILIASCEGQRCLDIRQEIEGKQVS